MKENPVSDVLLRLKASDTDKGPFMEAYGDIYEHSPWVAEDAWAARNGKNLDTASGLHSAMAAAMTATNEASQMSLICAHPDLAGKLAVAGKLTEASKSEQAGAGLDHCTEDEFREFQSLNNAYKEKFGFPFIIAVKGHDRHSILAAFRARINNDPETEFHTALEQINHIAFFRLMALVETL